jgi:hypothetical protein
LCFNYYVMKFSKLVLFLIISAVGMSLVAEAQSSNDRPKVVIDEVELMGTLLPEPIQQRLVASLKQREYDEDSEWVNEIHDLVGRAETEGWPDRENQGYLGFSYSARWKPLRREPGLLHVFVSVRVNEGQPKRLKAIEFRYVGDRSGRPVLDPDDLRKLIPLNDGEIYNRDSYYAGLSAVSSAYNQRGFIDCTVAPTTQLDDVNQTVSIVIDVNEGSRYQWRDIRVTGLDPPIEALLRSRLTPGSPVNPKLIRDFYDEYKSLLPVGASPETVKWESDAQNAIVDLTFDFSTGASPPVHN